MNRATDKKNEILNTALSLVRKLGFEAVSIANLANEVGMSKSGLFAHFNSKEKMHLMILDHAAMNFTQAVIVPAISEPRGLPRLKRIIDHWVKWYGNDSQGTCPFIAAGVEYDWRPGLVKDRLQFHLDALIKSITKAIHLCIGEGHFRSECNPDQLAFKVYSLMLGFQMYKKTLHKQDAEKLLRNSLADLYEMNKN